MQYPAATAVQLARNSGCIIPVLGRSVAERKGSSRGQDRMVVQCHCRFGWHSKSRSKVIRVKILLDRPRTYHMPGQGRKYQSGRTYQ